MAPFPRHLSIALLLTAVPGICSAATIVVDTAADVELDDGLCSLREAIVAANGDAAYFGCAAGAGDDLVVFGLPTPATLPLDSALPTITASLTLAGPGSGRLSIDGQLLVPLLLFDTPEGDGLLEVRDLALTRGDSTGLPTTLGGGATVLDGDSALFLRVVFRDNRADNLGGGLLLISDPPGAATAWVEECLFEGNVAQGPAGGGGIYASSGSVLAVVASTFVDNRAEAEFGTGGAMFLRDAEAVIQRSTVSANRASSSGGGIAIAAGPGGTATVAITDTTITANVAETNGDTQGDGGGIYVQSNLNGGMVDLTLGNSLVAGNFDSGFSTFPDLTLSGPVTLSSLSFNLLGANDGGSGWPTGTPNAAGDYVGTVATPVDPLLEPLGEHGGPTPVHLPASQPASVTVDHGLCAQPAADQRGHRNPTTGTRPVDHPTVPNSPSGDRCDIGAVELGAGPAPGAPLFADGFESGTPYLWSASLLE